MWDLDYSHCAEVYPQGEYYGLYKKGKGNKGVDGIEKPELIVEIDDKRKVVGGR